MALQGPHHSAQKSTTVNLSLSNTVAWKFASVNSNAIFIVLYVCLNQIYYQSIGTAHLTFPPM